MSTKTTAIVLAIACGLVSCSEGPDDPNAASDVVLVLDADDLLQGASGTLAVQSIPEYQPDPALPEDYEVATADGLVRGLEMHKSRLVLMLDPGSTVEAVNARLREVAARVAGYAGTGSIFVELLGNPTQEQLVAARNYLEQSPEIRLAVEDVVVQTQESGETVSTLNHANGETCGDPPDASAWTGTYFGGEEDRKWFREEVSGNWWVEFIRMPAAWNFNDAVRRRAEAQATLPQELATPIGVLDAGFQDHPDLLLLGDRSRVSCHGNMVAGIIAGSHDKHAHVDGEKGIEGIHPFARVQDSTVPLDFGAALDALITAHFPDQEEPVLTDPVLLEQVKPTFARQLVGLSDLLKNHKDTRVVNVSLGFNWQRCLDRERPNEERCIHPRDDPQAKRLLGAYARLGWQVIGNRGVLIVSAAGNASLLLDAGDLTWGEVDAKWASPFNYLALEGIEDESGESVKAENILVVESVTWQGAGGRRSYHSNTGGHVAAPGACMTTTAINNAYARGSGTSFAAPIVTGLAGYLWSIDPRLTVTEVKGLIVDSGTVPASLSDGGFDMAFTPYGLCDFDALPAYPNEPGQPPVVDAFATVMRLENASAQLVDVDDGTVDGVTVTGPGAEMTRPGDGQVDMSDFRAFRDAVAQLRAAVLDQPFHIKRDNNRDGCVYDGENCTVREEIWSRFDFNGDGRLSDIDAARTYLAEDSRDQPAPPRTDLDVLRSVWPGTDENWNLHCANEDNRLSEGWCAGDLDALLDSRDVIVDLSSFALSPGEHVKVGLRIGNHSISRNMQFDGVVDPRMVFTIPFDIECSIPVPIDTFSRCNNYMVYAIASRVDVARAGSLNRSGTGATAAFHTTDRGTDIHVSLQPDVTITLDQPVGTATETVMTATASYSDQPLPLHAPAGSGGGRVDWFSVTGEDGCGVSVSCVEFIERSLTDRGQTYRFIPKAAGLHTLHFTLRQPFCEEPDGICEPLPFLPFARTMQLSFSVGQSQAPLPEPPAPDPAPEPEPPPPYPEPYPLPDRLPWEITDPIRYEVTEDCDEASGIRTVTRQGTRHRMPTKSNPSKTEGFSESMTFTGIRTCFSVHGRRRFGAFLASSSDTLTGGTYPDKSTHAKTIVHGHHARCPVDPAGKTTQELLEACYDRVWRVGRKRDGTTYGYYEFFEPQEIYPAYPEYPF